MAAVFRSLSINPLLALLPAASPGNDTLAGTSDADSIDGLAGHDTIWGRGGNDTIRGGGDTLKPSYEQTSTDPYNWLYGGDGLADFTIRLLGVSSLTAGDFPL